MGAVGATCCTTFYLIVHQDTRYGDRFIFKFSAYKTNKKCSLFLRYFINTEKINRTFINFHLNKTNLLVSGNLIGLPYHHD